MRSANDNETSRRLPSAAWLAVMAISAAILIYEPRGSEPHGPALAGPPRGFLAAGSFPSSNANGRPWLKPDRP